MAPKSVLIAGAKAGIGIELVRQFAQDQPPPKFVFSAGRNANKAEGLVELANKYPNVVLVELDVTNDQQIKQAVEFISEKVGQDGLNLLINNAAILNPAGNHLPEISRQTINDHLNVNATSPLMVIQAFIPLLKKAADQQPKEPMSIRKAAVINISSDSGSLHTPIDFSASEFGFYGYAGSKGALNLLSKNLSFDLRPMGILIAFLCPGYVETDMTREMLAKVRSTYGDKAVPKFLMEENMCTPEQSVHEIMSMLKRLKDGHTGGYFKRNGEKLEDYDFESAAA